MADNSNVFFKICFRFYQGDSCPYANTCNYRHVPKDEVILQELPAQHKPYVLGRYNVPNRSAAGNPSCSVQRTGDNGTSCDNDNRLVQRQPICRFFVKGNCRNGYNCRFLHDPTAAAATTTTNKNRSSKRYDHNINTFSNTYNVAKEPNETTSALERSKEKMCCVCLEVIMEKALREQRFGILPNCNHCFCLTCIRQWRQVHQFDTKVIRACPQCRVVSDFVCPSSYWVETKDDKDKLITDYKTALSTKDCKYFKRGSGKCPFGNKCFYLHALVDGTKCDVGPPTRHHRISEGDEDMWQQFMLRSYLETHENRWLYAFAEDIEDLVSFFSDSDSDSESTSSEYSFMFGA